MMPGISFSKLNLKMNQISTYESCNAITNARKYGPFVCIGFNLVTISMLQRHKENTVYY